jgi:hypothetical protein
LQKRKRVQLDETSAPKGWSFRGIDETFAVVSELTEGEHREQIAVVFAEFFADGLHRLDKLRKSQAVLKRLRRHNPEIIEAVPAGLGYRKDNIATKTAPVWRGRVTTPLTPWAVRMQIIAQAEGNTDEQRHTYVRRRLTALDRALTDDEAAALEEWLICEEVLSGRAKGQSWGDRTGGGSGQRSPVPDSMMARMERHAELRRRMPVPLRFTLIHFATMMGNPYWDFGPRAQQRRTIQVIQRAAAWLAGN